MGPAVKTKVKQTADNPKHRQHNAKKRVQNNGIGTKKGKVSHITSQGFVPWYSEDWIPRDETLYFLAKVYISRQK